MNDYKPASDRVLGALAAVLIMNAAQAEDTFPDCASVGYDPLVKDSPLPKVEACKHGRNLIMFGTPDSADQPAKKATPILRNGERLVPKKQQDQIQFNGSTEF